jgi:acyl carrier protein phosphodiesterase
MNFLAHLHLSGNDEDVMLGNFMADSIKGRAHENYPPNIQKGILLHRFIDDYTDNHPIVLQSKLVFRPKYHKLAPILVDMVYDHFLAANWEKHHDLPLSEFVQGVYDLFDRRFEDLTPHARHMIPYMKQHNWLYNYQFKEGMERVFLGMSNRVRNGEILKEGWQDLELNYDEIGEHFHLFFSDLQEQCDVWMTLHQE